MYKLVTYRGKYAAQWTENGQRKRRSLGTDDLIKAKRKLAQIETVKAFNTRPEANTIGDIWPMYIKDKSGLARVETMQHQWKSLAPIFSHLATDGITPNHLKSYTDSRLRAGRKIGTIRGELLLIRQILNWAVKRRLIKYPSYVEVPPAPEPKDLYLTKDQAREYLHACSAPHIKLFVMLALATAGRKEALLNLTWDRVSFERSQINLKSKNSRRQKGRAIVPMNNELRAALQDAQFGALSEYVIEYSGGKILNIKKGLQGAGKRSGLTWVTAHVFRHSAAVWLAEANTPMSVIAQFLGHSDTKTTERVYARYSPSYMAGIADNLTLNDVNLVQLNQRSVR